MKNKLGSGSRIIRMLLLWGMVVAVCGVVGSFSLMGKAGDNQEIARLGLIGLIAFAFEGLSAAAVLAMLATRNLVQKVKVLAAALDRCADGDLTAKVTVSSQDEFGMLNRNFNLMLERLGTMARRIHDAIGELGRISGSVRDVSRRGAATAEIHFQGFTGASAAVTEINVSVREVAQAVEGLSRLSGDNLKSITRMSTSMDNAIISVEALTRAVDEVSGAIAGLTAAEQEIGSSVKSLQHDSASTAALVAEMDRTIKQVEKNVQEAAALSDRVKLDAEEGHASVQETISGIGEIHRSARISAETILNLSARTDDIGKILQVIDQLASQTNLLSLNASIIAAQAGEHGKGFAVVAGQIKELALRTTASTREIGEIIEGVQVETRRAVTAISASEERIDEGERLSQRSGEALRKIVESVQLAASQIAAIAHATVQQASQSQDMRRSMERVAEMVGLIARATRDQETSSESIMSAVTRMTGLSSQTLNSIREQKEAGGRVVRSSEEVTEMIASIRDACTAQTGSSSRIVAAMEQMKSSIETTMEITRVMEDVVAALSRQTEVLQKEMRGFRIER